MGFRKNRMPSRVKNMLVITMILFVIFVLLSIWIINDGITPTLMEIAELRTEEFATRAINSAVRFAEEYDFEEVTEMTRDNEGNITTYGWSSNIVSEINRVSTDRVEEFFYKMNRGEPLSFDTPLEEPIDAEGDASYVEQDPTLIEVPIGQATGNAILANLGPTIPVNLELVGAVRTDVVHEIEPFGINGALLILYLIVEADVQIVIPFTTEVAEVTTKIYIDSGTVMGEVPDFFGGGNNDPSISVPREDFQD
ncbi:sporulation protein YunB [Virgibacillus natechei]|uniref:Sporulation protein YunB n=2 Tax=Virgibacillus natechei TaxID=1216297 RepID=A0ABS4IGR6_9BACI|nr:sporulation protein YunB [Virgibacillus natechei]